MEYEQADVSIAVFNKETTWQSLKVKFSVLMFYWLAENRVFIGSLLIA
ncbi:hypothetical protein T4B_51 [Trichinella pseudospiralis]|uniref:Uncharacterized protein n=1 Tax=Trichinella pseudospiralis TaxID=6337 RepID=A0A0V1GSP5_TRIPS|nr:hypothetical protein T4B_51 [Trichinella pseudospiralis]